MEKVSLCDGYLKSMGKYYAADLRVPNNCQNKRYFDGKCYLLTQYTPLKCPCVDAPEVYLTKVGGNSSGAGGGGVVSRLGGDITLKCIIQVICCEN